MGDFGRGRVVVVVGRGCDVYKRITFLSNFLFVISKSGFTGWLITVVVVVVVVVDVVVALTVDAATVELPSFRITCNSSSVIDAVACCFISIIWVSYQFWRRLRIAEEGLGDAALHGSFA